MWTSRLCLLEIAEAKIQIKILEDSVAGMVPVLPYINSLFYIRL